MIEHSNYPSTVAQPKGQEGLQSEVRMSSKSMSSDRACVLVCVVEERFTWAGEVGSR